MTSQKQQKLMTTIRRWYLASMGLLGAALVDLWVVWPHWVWGSLVFILLVIAAVICGILMWAWGR